MGPDAPLPSPGWWRSPGAQGGGLAHAILAEEAGDAVVVWSGVLVQPSERDGRLDAELAIVGEQPAAQHARAAASAQLLHLQPHGPERCGAQVRGAGRDDVGVVLAAVAHAAQPPAT